MSVRSEVAPIATPAADMQAALAETTPADAHLGEGQSYSVATPENPLHRQLVVSVRTSLNELCLNKQKGTWAPSGDALKAIFQQKRFTSLDGSAEQMGDLKSMVLHDMSITHTKSTFPVSLGTKISGVDDSTFSSTGEAFSSIVLPNCDSSAVKKLQADDVSLAYEQVLEKISRTAENLSEKGVHEVAQRRFVLVAADHPIVSAISENADKLQMGEISMMQEGLASFPVRFSAARRIEPSIAFGSSEGEPGRSDACIDRFPCEVVKTQVESQIKVRDLSKAMVTLAPAEYASWSDARAELMMEAKRPLKAQLQAELGAAADNDQQEAIRAAFSAREKAIEHDIDHKPMDMHMCLDVAYNFLSK